MKILLNVYTQEGKGEKCRGKNIKTINEENENSVMNNCVNAV